MDQVFILWEAFKSNCDLLVKVLHIPSFEMVIRHAVSKQEESSRALSFLLFAIYFAAAASLSESACLRLLGDDKNRLLEKYKMFTEQALARAGLLVTHEIMVLQALVIYLASLRGYNTIGTVGALTSIAVRLAHNCGIHRDGTHFALSPFATEMRRRLWWNIYVLDARACEDSGYETAILHEKSDTKMPLNINDDDIMGDMTQYPQAKLGPTDMTFCLERFKATFTIRRLQEMPIGEIGRCGKLHAASTLAQKSAWILEYQAELQDVLSEYNDKSKPYNWYVMLASRILLSKMWLIAYYPYLCGSVCGRLSQDTKDGLFLRAISLIESHLLLCTGEPTRQWGWLCITHVQWYAMRFVLSELSERIHGTLEQRGWDAVNAALQLWSDEPSMMPPGSFGSGGQDSNEDRARGYRPLSHLLSAAREARERGPCSRSSPSSSTPACEDSPPDFIVGSYLYKQLNADKPA